MSIFVWKPKLLSYPNCLGNMTPWGGWDTLEDGRKSPKWAWEIGSLSNYTGGCMGLGSCGPTNAMTASNLQTLQRWVNMHVRTIHINPCLLMLVDLSHWMPYLFHPLQEGHRRQIKDRAAKQKREMTIKTIQKGSQKVQVCSGRTYILCFDPER